MSSWRQRPAAMKDRRLRERKPNVLSTSSVTVFDPILINRFKLAIRLLDSVQPDLLSHKVTN